MIIMEYFDDPKAPIISIVEKYTGSINFDRNKIINCIQNDSNAENAYMLTKLLLFDNVNDKEALTILLTKFQDKLEDHKYIYFSNKLSKLTTDVNPSIKIITNMKLLKYDCNIAKKELIQICNNDYNQLVKILDERSILKLVFQYPLFCNKPFEFNPSMLNNLKLNFDNLPIGSIKLNLMIYLKTNTDLFNQYSKFCRNKYEILNTSPVLTPTLTKDTTKINIGFFASNFHIKHSISRVFSGIIAGLSNTIFNKVGFFFSKSHDYGKDSKKIWYSCDKRVIIPKSHSNTGMINSFKLAVEKENIDIMIYPELMPCLIEYYFAHLRLAPIQITTWGFPTTSGIDTIDYYITDEYLSNTQDQQYYTEKLVHLKEISGYFDDPVQIDPGTPDLSTLYLPEGYNIYICHQILCKIDDNFENIIKSILEKDSKALIVFTDYLTNYDQIVKTDYSYHELNYKKYLYSRLSKKIGMNMIRVHFIKKKSPEFLHKYLKVAKVALETTKFGGILSILDPISLGLPVVSMKGNSIIQRVGYAFYKKMGIENIVANSSEEYVSIAIRIANDDEYRKSLSNQILKGKSQIFNNKPSISEWERALIQINQTRINS